MQDNMNDFMIEIIREGNRVIGADDDKQNASDRRKSNGVDNDRDEKSVLQFLVCGFDLFVALFSLCGC